MGNLPFSYRKSRGQFHATLVSRCTKLFAWTKFLRHALFKYTAVRVTSAHVLRWHLSSLTLPTAVVGKVRPLLGSHRKDHETLHCSKNIYSLGSTTVLRITTQCFWSGEKTFAAECIVPPHLTTSPLQPSAKTAQVTWRTKQFRRRTRVQQVFSTSITAFEIADLKQAREHASKLLRCAHFSTQFFFVLNSLSDGWELIDSGMQFLWLWAKWDF